MTATNRYGKEFNVGDIVQMVDFPVLYRTMLDKKLEILKITEEGFCESGFNVLLKCVETGNEFKRPIDANWIQKLKQTI
jgi:hypothetical protein